jgi:hypothetical protein
MEKASFCKFAVNILQKYVDLPALKCCLTIIMQKNSPHIAVS